MIGHTCTLWGLPASELARWCDAGEAGELLAGGPTFRAASKASPAAAGISADT